MYCYFRWGGLLLEYLSVPVLAKLSDDIAEPKLLYFHCNV